MYNRSTIIQRKKQLACGHYDYNFSKNRCRSCATVENTLKRMAKAQDEEQVTRIPARQDNKPASGELERWFQERRREMKGVCLHCGGKTCRDDDQWFRASLAHILPKAYFPSVSTHPLNWIELCFWGNSCHTNMDNKVLDMTEMACWDTIVTRFQAMYPSIAPKERRRIPEILMQYIEIDL
jgi:hypothetical protein